MTARTALEWKPSEMLVTLGEGTGLAAEQYRKLGLRLEGLRETLGDSVRVILVTSPLMGEGKTATATNLALTLAREESRRVVLVDCDIRKPRIASHFTRPPEKGLADLLTGESSLDEIARPTTQGSLDVITLPKASDRRIDPLPLERLRSILRGELRGRYHFVVCDAPPVLPIADTAALLRLADGIVLVVRAGITPRQAVGRTLGMVDRNKLIGFVLNGVSERTLGKYYYGYYANENGGEPNSAAKRG